MVRMPWTGHQTKAEESKNKKMARQNSSAMRGAHWKNVHHPCYNLFWFWFRRENLASIRNGWKTFSFLWENEVRPSSEGLRPTEPEVEKAWSGLPTGQEEDCWHCPLDRQDDCPCRPDSQSECRGVATGILSKIDRLQLNLSIRSTSEKWTHDKQPTSRSAVLKPHDLDHYLLHLFWFVVVQSRWFLGKWFFPINSDGDWFDY